MSHKRFRPTFYLAFVFLLLLLFVVFYGNDSVQQKRIQERYSSPFISKELVSKVDTIRLTHTGSDDKVFTLKDGDWYLDSSLLDSTASEDFLNSIEDMPVGSISSRNPDNWESYNVDDENAYRLVLMDSDTELYSFYFGRPGQSSQSIYLRRNSEPEVYLVSSPISQFLYYDTNRWVSKAILPLDTSQISNFTVRVGDQKNSFVQRDAIWSHVTDSGELVLEDSEPLLTYLDNISSLKAQSLDNTQDAFVDSDLALAFTLTDGSEFIVSVDIQDPQSLVKITGSTLLYRFSTNITDTLTPHFVESLTNVSEPEVVE